MVADELLHTCLGSFSVRGIDPHHLGTNVPFENLGPFLTEQRFPRLGHVGRKGASRGIKEGDA
jgi:hypothetical protein